MGFENYISTMQDSGGGVSYNFMTNNWYKYVNCVNSNYFTKTEKAIFILPRLQITGTQHGENTMNFGFNPICHYRKITQLQLLYNPWRPSWNHEKQSCKG